jgi:hypothetical protein
LLAGRASPSPRARAGSRRPSLLDAQGPAVTRVEMLIHGCGWHQIPLMPDHHRDRRRYRQEQMNSLRPHFLNSLQRLRAHCPRPGRRPCGPCSSILADPAGRAMYQQPTHPPRPRAHEPLHLLGRILRNSQRQGQTRPHADVHIRKHAHRGPTRLRRPRPWPRSSTAPGANGAADRRGRRRSPPRARRPARVDQPAGSGPASIHMTTSEGRYSDRSWSAGTAWTASRTGSASGRPCGLRTSALNGNRSGAP